MFQVTEDRFNAWNIIKNYCYGLKFPHKLKATSQRSHRETDGKRQDVGSSHGPVLRNYLCRRDGEHNGRKSDSSKESNSENVVAKLQSNAAVRNLSQIPNSIDESRLWNNKSVPGRGRPKVRKVLYSKLNVERHL